MRPAVGTWAIGASYRVATDAMRHISRRKCRRVAGRAEQGRLHCEAQHFKQRGARDQMVAEGRGENEKSGIRRSELGIERNQSADEDVAECNLNRARVAN